MNESTVRRRFFAASNSAKGFRNYYGECFSESRCDRLYIIKGGPGTGKSHFMRTVARHASMAGYTVTEYDCSSDPVSLDGILLQKAGLPVIGLLDGTAPHVCEPTTPGVREEIVNLGALWDASRLTGEGKEIRRLAARKTAAYERAYSYLRAAGEMDAIADALSAPAVKEDRLSAMAERLLRREPTGDAFDAVPALRRAVSMTGRAVHHTFEAMAENLYVVEDVYGLGYRLMAHLLAYSQCHRHTVLVSYDPVYPDKIDGLFYPASGRCILVGYAEAREDCPARTVSLRRYIVSERLREVRGELRHAVSLRKQLEEDALLALAEASRHHFDLENIYAAAMDFPSKECFTEDFCRDLFPIT